MANAEQLENYIPIRIERLQRQKKTATIFSFSGELIALAIPFYSLRMIPEAMILFAVVWIGSRVIRALADIHIDMLSGQWRDMDRDAANEMYDFETKIPYT